MKITLIFITIFMICGCHYAPDEEYERVKKIADKAANDDWLMSIDVMLLSEAYHECAGYEMVASIEACADVFERVRDYSNAVYTCEVYHNSSMCKSLLIDASENIDSLAYLPVGDDIGLPSTPFYLGMNNIVLDWYATKYDYRREIATYAWKRWWYLVLICVGAMIAAAAIIMHIRVVRGGSFVHAVPEKYEYAFESDEKENNSGPDSGFREYEESEAYDKDAYSVQYNARCYEDYSESYVSESGDENLSECDDASEVKDIDKAIDDFALKVKGGLTKKG